MNNILVDTNVLIYAIDEDSKYFERSYSFISQTGLNLYTTSKNLSELLSVITRSPTHGLPIMEALSVVDDFFNFLSILYPTQKSYELFLDLLKKHQVEGLQIHDFEIASIGLSNGINRIATFNEKDFKAIEALEVYFP